MLDLGADIIPGVSAGGFTIGESLEAVRARLSEVLEWRDEQLPPDGESYQEFLTHYEGWILTWNPRSGEYYLRSRSVAMNFSRQSKTLYSIYIYEGYTGRYKGHLGVGSLLKEAFRYGDWEFYDEDDMFYPVDITEKSLGLAAPSPDDFDDFDCRPIWAISIHDWDIGKRER